MAGEILTEQLMESLGTSRPQEEVYDAGFKVGGSFGVRLSKGGRKSFFVVYPLHGKRKRMTLGNYPALSLERAKELATETIRKATEGRDPKTERLRYRNADTFGELCQTFVEEHVKENCAPKTQREYQRIIDQELLPLWRDIKASDLKSRDIVELIDDIADNRGKLVLANRVRALLSRIYNFALEKRLVANNPVGNTEKAYEEAPRERALTFEEIRMLWQLLSQETPLIKGVFQMLLLTGQRPGEIMSMRWDDIQLENWTVKTKKENGGFAHQIFLSPQALNVLREMQKLATSSRYVFATNSSKHIVYIRKASRRLSAQLGTDFSPSDLRRTAEIRMRDMGVQPHIIEKILNRKTVPARFRRYYEKYDYSFDVRNALLRWGQKIAATSPPPSKRRSRKKPASGKVISLFGDDV